MENLPLPPQPQIDTDIPKPKPVPVLELQQEAQTTNEKKRFSIKKILITILIVLLILTAILVGYILATRDNSDSAFYNLDLSDTISIDKNDSVGRYWFINKITPSDTGLYSVELISNIGNIRTYNDIISFGLSHNREYFVAHTINDIRVIKLNDESHSLVETPNPQFYGIRSDSIVWSKDDNYFLMSIATDESLETTKVWVFTVDGKLQKEIIEKIQPNSDKTVEPALFSNKENDLLLVKTYSEIDAEDLDEDGSEYAINELPVYLKVYNVIGEVKKEIMVRDFDTDGNNVYFQWDTKLDRTINFYIWKDKNEFDVNQDYLFTKVRI